MQENDINIDFNPELITLGNEKNNIKNKIKQCKTAIEQNRSNLNIYKKKIDNGESLSEDEADMLETITSLGDKPEVELQKYEQSLRDVDLKLEKCKRAVPTQNKQINLNSSSENFRANIITNSRIFDTNCYTGKRSSIANRMNTNSEYRDYYSSIHSSLKSNYYKDNPQALRDIINANKTIPYSVQIAITEQMDQYSQLMPLVTKSYGKGETRRTIPYGAPPAAFGNKYGNLNEISYYFKSVDLLPKKISGYILFEGYDYRESIIELATFIEKALAKALTIGLENAMLVGSGNTVEPMGIYTLAQTMATNDTDMKTIVRTETGTGIHQLTYTKGDDLTMQIIEKTGGIQNSPNIVAVMTRRTYAMMFAKDTKMVSQMNNTIKVDVKDGNMYNTMNVLFANSVENPNDETAPFDALPDNVVIVGDLSNYYYAMSDTITIGTSEQAMWIEDKMISRVITHADGRPVNYARFAVFEITPTRSAVTADISAQDKSTKSK